MISIEEAERIILDQCQPRAPIEVPLLEAGGYAVAADMRSGDDVPPFNRAMMDGFAFRAADTTGPGARLRVVDCLPAGTVMSGELPPGAAVKIMTGAPLPSGADTVMPKEQCREHPDDMVAFTEIPAAGRHVATRGSELAAGSPLFAPGDVLKASDLGVLAIFGFTRVRVYPRPVLSLTNTGSELVDIDQPPTGGRIRNSDMYSIASYFRKFGYTCAVRGIVPDHEAAIRSAVSAEPDADVILLTGGVSVGDYDLVQTAVRAEGFEVLFDAVAIKPGKPLVFARKGRQLLFGLSGNPVSSLLQAARFVLPALRRLAGWNRPGCSFVTAALTEPMRHRGDRTAYRPCRLVAEEGRLLCRPVRDKGSADLFSWRTINGLAVLPADRPELAAGELVRVFILEPFNFLPAE